MQKWELWGEIHNQKVKTAYLASQKLVKAQYSESVKAVG